MSYTGLVERLRKRSSTFSWDSTTYYTSDADMMRQAADTIEALTRPVDGWQPIETAPKLSVIWLSDGTLMRLGFWAEGKQHENFGTVGGGWIDHASAEGTGPRGLRFRAKHWCRVPRSPALAAMEAPHADG